MSVPKGRRKEAYSAYVQKMIELHKLTCDRTGNAPARYRKMLCTPLNELDSEAYLEILHANELFPKNPEMTEERDGHLREAYSTILRMQEPLWNFWNVLNFDTRRETFWADRINEEIRLILGLLNRGEKKIFFGPRESLEKTCAAIKEAADTIGLTVNTGKIRLQKVTAPFTFLKIRYRVTETGKILRQITRSGIVQQRRKLKRFRRLVGQGKMSRDDVIQSVQSWLAHLHGLKARHAGKNMIRRCRELLGSREACALSI